MGGTICAIGSIVPALATPGATTRRENAAARQRSMLRIEIILPVDQYETRTGSTRMFLSYFRIVADLLSMHCARRDK
jgi:hypothetical protein